MRILFIQPQSTMFERLGVMYLGSALKMDGHEVAFVVAARLGAKKLRAYVREFAPHVIGYSVMTGEHISVLKINHSLKQEFAFLSVLGGPHPTFYPEVIREEGCDAVCVGEGDLAFPDFCRRVERGEAYWETPNFDVKKDGRVFTNPPRPLIEDLDTLPLPDRDLMYQGDPPLAREGRKMFFSTRGCPFRCSYCFNHAYNNLYKREGPLMRFRSPEAFVDEICRLRERYPVDYVVIGDDTFLIRPKDWLDRFCATYKERLGLPFACAARAGLVTEERIAQLRSVGLHTCGMGLECGDEEICRTVVQRDETNEEKIVAAKIIQDLGIKLIAFNLSGLPVPNSYETDLKTLDLNIRMQPTYALAGLVYPYPRTDIERYAREHAFLTDEPPVLETNKRSSMFAFTSPLEKRRVENLQKLFGIIVRFPFLRRYADFLCGLPQNRLYLALFFLFYGYSYKMKIWPLRSWRREMGNYIRLYLQILRKS